MHNKGEIDTYCSNNGFTLFDHMDYMDNDADYKQCDICIDSSVSESLLSICKGYAQLFHVYAISVVKVLLHKLTFNNTITLGIPTILNDVKESNIIGILEYSFEGDELFKDVLGVSKSKVLDLYAKISLITENQHVTDKNKFDAAVAIENIHNIASITDNNLNLYFLFKINNNEIIGKLGYNSYIYESGTIQRIIGCFNTIIEQTVKDSLIPVKKIQLISNKEKEKIYSLFNNTDIDFDKTASICDYLDNIFMKYPDRIAYIQEDLFITYKELDKRTSLVAGKLIQWGISENSIIGVIGENSIDSIINIIAVLRSGAAFIPIDINYPGKRIEYILKDSSVKLVLSDSLAVIDQVNLKDIKVLNTNTLNYSAEEKLEYSKVSSSSYAYVIYTSGSTGLPKGTLIKHKSLVNLCEWHKRNFNLSCNDISTKMAGFSFDASVWEIFPYLINGSATLILDEKNRYSVQNIYEKLKRYSVTKSFVPTKIAEDLVSYGDLPLEYLLTGGEKLNKYQPSNYKFINNYGPTESTVVATSYYISENSGLTKSIGSPIDNTKIFITDLSAGNLMPIGAEGEICISGEGLSVGYLNEPELTHEKFIYNNFLNKGLLYRTGDKGKWTTEGIVEFTGRLDNQVKLRGFRIELHEIEHIILKFERIDNVVVRKINWRNTESLCAYYISDHEILNSDLSGFIAQYLPPYMIPSFFVRIKQIPLNNHGKIDSEALPMPQVEVVESDFECLSNEEKYLANEWSKILEIEKKEINSKSNFFELGGHSLNASVLLTKIKQDLSLSINLKDIFEHRTLSEMASLLEKSQNKDDEKIKSIEKREYYKLSPAQNRIYFLEQFEHIKYSYSIPVVFKIHKGFDLELFKNALNKVLDKYEILRSFYKTINGVPYMFIQEKVHFEIEKHDIISIDEKDAVYESFFKKIQLDIAPLIRLGIICIDNESKFLLINIHHIIADGTSVYILLEDLARAYYSGKLLNSSGLEYKDYSYWLENNYNNSKIEKEKLFWIKELGSNLPILNFPTDFERKERQSFKGETFSIHLNESLYKSFKTVGKAQQTLFMRLLSILYIVLNKYTGQEDILIGTSSFGRTNYDLQNMIGLFINKLPIRTYINPKNTYLEILDEVESRFINILINQDLQFNDLVDLLKIKRDPSRNPIFDITIDVQNFNQSSFQIEEIEFLYNEFNSEAIRFDIAIHAYEYNEELIMDFEYSTELFLESSIKSLSERMIEAIRQVVGKDGKIKIEDITFTTNYRTPAKVSSDLF